MNNVKLFLYSLGLSHEQSLALANLVGKKTHEVSLALIENATDIIKDSKGWVLDIRKSLEENGFQIEPVDLREWSEDKNGLRKKLMSKDVIWVCGGHTYYLNWILKDSGADKIIKDFVRQGKVFAGWSAGAVVAGPTTQYFDSMGDDPIESPAVILEGLKLTNFVVVPHIDNPDFREGAMETNKNLLLAGHNTILLRDSQVLTINGGEHQIL